MNQTNLWQACFKLMRKAKHAFFLQKTKFRPYESAKQT
ncbi:hypothetical protein SYNTR_2063 [Candidatus Syntrophocurvum alkaliphilum]|uniref:Uncharacterized protein n=1 Tax=Candidatus Syntrophocurvum alkaliphilum TaxID=2293317 RepID=A0A6I6DLE4_9FIRM|nr:hypothetical protein SYNTR_2063 [Candidatus Syntrophocurvum alkaliphilum]